MKIEICLKEMIEILKMASLGKLMSGLIHNLNSPLQNIGMDIELAAMYLKDNKQVLNEITEKLSPRIERMENEFERINQILKRGTFNIQMDEYYLKSMTLTLFIQQVMKMLEANLYFKHNVKKEMNLVPDLPKLNQRSEDFWFALIWFMQSMIDNIEKNEIKELIIKTGKNGQNQELIFQIKEGKFSADFLKSLNTDTSLPDYLQIAEDAMLHIALHVLRSEGVVSRGESTGSATIITLLISH